MRKIIYIFIMGLFLFNCDDAAGPDNEPIIIKLEFFSSRCIDSACTKYITYSADTLLYDSFCRARIIYSPGFKLKQQIKFCILKSFKDTIWKDEGGIGETLVNLDTINLGAPRNFKNEILEGIATILENDSIIWTGRDTVYFY